MLRTPHVIAHACIPPRIANGVLQPPLSIGSAHSASCLSADAFRLLAAKRPTFVSTQITAAPIARSRDLRKPPTCPDAVLCSDCEIAAADRTLRASFRSQLVKPSWTAGHGCRLELSRACTPCRACISSSAEYLSVGQVSHTVKPTSVQHSYGPRSVRAVALQQHIPPEGVLHSSPSRRSGVHVCGQSRSLPTVARTGNRCFVVNFCANDSTNLQCGVTVYDLSHIGMMVCSESRLW